MAVTTFAEMATGDKAPVGDEGDAGREYLRTTKDAFYFSHTETVDGLDQRGAELEELLDEGLAEGLARLMQRL